MVDHPPIAAGKSSYDLIDPLTFWPKLALTPGSTVLDLGCGAGRYTLPMADQVGPKGKVIAIDLWDEGIEQLKQAAIQEHVTNIDARAADAGGPLPLEDQSMDVCFMATTLHDFVRAGIAAHVLGEVARVLKPRGTMAVVEFVKQDSAHGPPRHVRLAVEDVAVLVQRLGFIRCSGVMDLSPDLYLTKFGRLARARR